MGVTACFTPREVNSLETVSLVYSLSLFSDGESFGEEREVFCPHSESWIHHSSWGGGRSGSLKPFKAYSVSDMHGQKRFSSQVPEMWSLEVGLQMKK